MTASNFNWMIHVMLHYHTQVVLDKQDQKKEKTEGKNDGDDENEDEDESEKDE